MGSLVPTTEGTGYYIGVVVCQKLDDKETNITGTITEENYQAMIYLDGLKHSGKELLWT